MNATATMNGKPVFEVPAKSVLNMKSGFIHKLLCDGPTFTAGTACGFSCSYCYVPAMTLKSPHLKALPVDVKHHEAVIRRSGAIEALEQQLTNRRRVGGRVIVVPKYNDTNDKRVLYMSPLVDIAANQELANETVTACAMILKLTHWHIRLLSKSVLIRSVAEQLDAYSPDKDRLIFGLSVGTGDDKLAASFEVGTSKVSARINTLHWLQDNGFRTFGMICPSLPQRNYLEFATQMHGLIRGERCEHVWAEVMNARGESFDRTKDALVSAGYGWEADELAKVSNPDDQTEWELYSRNTFLAHAQFYRPGQLRFLQYVNRSTRDWWSAQRTSGAVLL